jgi:predicted O-linked N-acetylglucosamine transferase (SPINDLY family)
MNYQHFLEQIPTFYENWEQRGCRPKSNRFQKIIDQVQSMTTANIMQLLNFAVRCMEPEEIYCEIGCFQGGSLIGALLDHYDKFAFAVDNFSEFNPWGNNDEILLQNLANFELNEQVCFCSQDFEEFFLNLREIEVNHKIGVYFYDGSHDYRSHLMGLLCVRPFLAQKSLIVTVNSNWQAIQQANRDFLALNPSAKSYKYFFQPQSTQEQLCLELQIIVWHQDNGSIQPSKNYSINQQNITFIKSIYNLQTELKQLTQPLYQEAIQLDCSEVLEAGIVAGKTYSPEFLGQIKKDLLKAEQKYKEILQWEQDNVDVWLRLGRLYYVLGRYQESIEMLIKSLNLDPLGSIQHYLIGAAFEKMGNNDQAIRAYQEAIALNPHLVDAYNNFGNLLLKSDQLDQAKLVYRQAVSCNPNHFGSYLNLGNIFLLQQEVEKAISTYETALKLNPTNPDILYNLGVAYQIKNDQLQAFLYFGDAFYYQEKYEDSIIEYQKFLENEIGNTLLYFRVADCYQYLNRYEEAIKVCRNALFIYPTEVGLCNRLVSLLQGSGCTQKAIEVATEASLALPDDLSLRLAKCLTLPILYETQEEVNFYRSRFSQGLEEVIQLTQLNTPQARSSALIGIGRHTNFYLQYQCKNDVELQKKYGQFVHRIMKAKYPEWTEGLPMPSLSKNGKIRVGYICDSMRSDGAGKLYLGWLENYNKQKFEVYCYYTYPSRDQLTRQFQLYSNVFYHIPNDLEAACRKVLADQLHILIFPAIGMTSLIMQMAGLRLAPIQCTTWAHPVTSGLPTIDYFLTSAVMEPENAQEYYSEQLIRLPKFAFSYAKPIIPDITKTRSDFKLREDAVIYLSCQSLSKYLPRYDHIFPEIALRVASAQFAFVSSHRSPHITEQFQQRLQKAFAKFGLKMEDYCVIVPRQTAIGYFNLMLASDIFLDTMSYSGGFTTLDAIACDLPIVTCPGELMRGRQSYAFLKILDVTETIAKNEADYIEIAARLGLNPQLRDSIIQKMKQRHSYLYNDQTCITVLEEFYQRVVEEYSVKNQN